MVAKNVKKFYKGRDIKLLTTSSIQWFSEDPNKQIWSWPHLGLRFYFPKQNKIHII